jgi:FKBP-type peptidyl-prolyl cis-trans isomerase FkpA
MSRPLPAFASLAAACALLLSAPGSAQPSDAPTRQAPIAAEDQERLLHALGVSLGRSVESFALTPEELKVVARGLEESGTSTADLEALLPRLKEFELKRRERRLAQEKERGKAYVATLLASQKDATQTSSGLVYQTVSEGIGPSPSSVDTVRVHYRGRLIDGREFDSSYRTGQPAQFALRGVVPCWTEGLQRMKANGRARLVCPPSIGYGDRGNPPRIPGGATLVFDVELLEVVPRGATRVQ